MKKIIGLFLGSKIQYKLMNLLELPKRKTCLVQYPQEYCIKCDICGGENLHWSEWEYLVWCYDCEVDTKGTGGIFDGPIPIGTASLLGICFDRVNIETSEVIKFDLKTGEYQEQL